MTEQRKARVLIVDDEKRLCRSLQILLEEEGPFEVFTAHDYYSAIENLKEPIDLVLTDLTMPGKSGLDLLRAIRERSKTLPVILMTAYSTVESAVIAMKEGALDYIVKPFENEKLIDLVRKALRNVGIETLKPAVAGDADRFGDLIGKSKVMRDVYEKIQRAAETDSTVLLTGESGTGKELAAKAIHYSGSRKAKPFIALNCTAMPENLLESELFGHERGAFSGAIRQREGKFELSHLGTLFLDEVGDMTPSLQVKLLRVLQEKEFVRVGGEKTIQVDVRIIAATNRDLSESIRTGRFREDLFYRLNVVHLQLPSLRERPEDLPPLIEHFLNEKCRKAGVLPKKISNEAMKLLLDYPYPGNVRELENIVERAVVLTAGTTIHEKDLPISNTMTTPNPASFSVPVQRGLETLEKMQNELEKEVIERALKLYPNKSNTELAEILGTSRRVFESRLKLYNLRK